VIVDEQPAERVPGELTIGVAVADFNQSITDRLLDGALEALEREGAGKVVVLRVPGAWELPLAAADLARRGCDAVVAIGAIIKGETDHYEVIVHHSAAGLTQVALAHHLPVANAVLAAHDVKQALDRSGPGPGNKGAEAALAAMTTACRIAARVPGPRPQ
jgi:6,7-dimethyl-8-ribityllumazine synthase